VLAPETAFLVGYYRKFIQGYNTCRTVIGAFAALDAAILVNFEINHGFLLCVPE
jgi:hypothetical protein